MRHVGGLRLEISWGKEINIRMSFVLFKKAAADSMSYLWVWRTSWCPTTWDFSKTVSSEPLSVRCLLGEERIGFGYFWTCKRPFIDPNLWPVIVYRHNIYPANAWGPTWVRLELRFQLSSKIVFRISSNLGSRLCPVPAPVIAKHKSSVTRST